MKTGLLINNFNWENQDTKKQNKTKKMQSTLNNIHIHIYAYVLSDVQLLKEELYIQFTRLCYCICYVDQKHM